MHFSKYIAHWSPRRVFLADAIGALLTTLILSMVLAQIKSILGLEKSTLYFLASIAWVFFCYSFTVFLVKPIKWTSLLRIIAVANLSYCLITWFILLQVEANLIAYIYFAGETLIVGMIAFTEWAYSKKFEERGFE